MLKFNTDNNIIDPAFGADRKTQSWVQRPDAIAIKDSLGAEQNQLDAFIAILRRRWRFIMATAFLATIAATLIAFIVPPKFTAKAQLLVDVESGAGRGASDPAALAEVIDTHLAMINSPPYLQTVVDNLATQATAGQPTVAIKQDSTTLRPFGDDPAIGGNKIDSQEENPSTGSELVRRLQIWLGLPWTTENRGVPSRRSLERNLRVIQEGRSRVITVAYTATGQQKAADIANRVAELYVHAIAERKRNQGESELANLVKSIDDAKAALEGSRSAIRALMAERAHQAGSNAATSQEQERRLQQLTQQATAHSEAYNKLLQRRSALRDKLTSQSSGIHLLSSASPPDRPSSHNPLYFIVPSFMLFGMGATLFSIFREQMDKTIRSAADVREVLAVPCIAEVPSLPKQKKGNSADIGAQETTGPYQEAIRSIATSLNLVTNTMVAECILVTSSAEQEGRTATATNLAAYLAAIGRAVLIVDFNRKGESGCNTATAMDGAYPYDGRSLLEFVQRSDDLDVDFLSLQSACPDPLILFANGSLPAAIEALKDNYHCIIFDSPPLLAAAEARLIVGMADQILVLARWGLSTSDDLRDATSLLRQVHRSDRGENANVFSVLIGVPEKRNQRASALERGATRAKTELG